MKNYLLNEDDLISRLVDGEALNIFGGDGGLDPITFNCGTYDDECLLAGCGCVPPDYQDACFICLASEP